MIVSFGTGYADNKPKRYSIEWSGVLAWLSVRRTQGPYTFEQYAALELNVKKAAKNTNYIAFADFGKGTRSKSCVLASYCIPIDLDTGGWTAERIAAHLSGYTFAAHTTYAHTSGAPRWRVIVRVERGMTAEEHAATWATLNGIFLGDADSAASDASRLNYLPGACVDPKAAQFIHEEGALFPVSAAPSEIAEPSADGGLRDAPMENWNGPTDDEILIAQALAHRDMKNPREAFGGVTKFQALWTGDAATLAELYPSKDHHQDWNYTTADLALANELAYFTGGDGERCVRLMCESALAHRSTWEERKARIAVGKACARRTQFAFMRRGPAPTPALSSPPAVAMLTVPKAQHLTTDQANAERLEKQYGKSLMACAGEFYAWDGRRWVRNDGLPQQFACQLSKIVRAEADAMRVEAAAAQAAINPVEIAASIAHPRLNALRKGETGSRAHDLAEIADALDAWSKKCEMKSVQDAALGLLKKLLNVEPSDLDKDEWLLNVANGTIDLRTGELREHRASDLITKLAPVAYDPAAQISRFRSFLAEIFNGDLSLVEFLARWFGYGATGSVREEKMVIHWGKGSNGKSTMLEIVEAVLGDYATPAPQGLLTAKNGDERHPAEIADLHGRRLVTASESEEGAKLREAFIKLTTGGDTLKGRRLYGQLFSFRPTHKIQLLTNHKPQIRGSDYAIWRRLLLVPYVLKFGTADELNAGVVDRLGDGTLKETLRHEMPGVLAWIVAGAREWYTMGGLRPPPAVVAEGAKYRTEQDRVGEFVRERCRLDMGATVLVATLYATYAGWCRDNGTHPLGRGRFIDELDRVVPGMREWRDGRGGRGYAGLTLV
ncbi:MAG: phage/plasmid primase, P4 family [Pseudomonadota bacterium]